MTLYTIGFTRTSAQSFFERLAAARVTGLVDVRLNNVSQLAGFAKRDDLRYFTRVVLGAPYAHRPELAPTPEMLDAYRKRGGSWDAYRSRFLELMASRRVEDLVSREEMNGACLLCSEHEPERCHRRLVAEYLRERWGGEMEIRHL